MDNHESLNRRRFLKRGAAAAALAAGVLPSRSEQKGDSQLAIAYIDDPARHRAANQAGRNYWNAYVPEVMTQLGVTAAKATPALLQDGKKLAGYSTLLICDLDIDKAGRTNLEEWVRDGGVAIAVGTKGIDELCGIRPVGQIAQQGDAFTYNAKLSFASHGLTAGIHSPAVPEQHLLIFSDAQQLKAKPATELARFHDKEGQDTGNAVITSREIGRGRIFYFGFNLFQTMWVLHQGRPVDKDYDGDGWLRRSDAILRRPNSPFVGYADELLFLLQNMMGTRPHAFIHQLPPMAATGGNRVPDALFFWGGDDEGSTAGIQITASNWMKEKGLPYHINLMPHQDGTFGLSLEDAHKIQANGHELAIHYNFIDGFSKGQGFTREQLLAQAAEFRKFYKIEQTCSVNHWNRWTGWAEPAKWMHETGQKADNSSPAVGSPPLNSINTVGFSFGTAFPFWFYDDWRGNNARIDILEEPQTAYECGYKGKDTDFPLLHKALDLATYYHLTMNFFYHPIYVANYPACREAITEALRYLDEHKIAKVHMGSDEVYRWWKARSESRATTTVLDDKSVSIVVEAAHPSGAIVKLPLGKRTLKSASLNGTHAPESAVKTEVKFGQNWAYIVVPSGKTLLRVASA